ncbi:hypothetical protein ACFVJS_22180 [Nocardioides sp. NPDC057772]|uniref:hypothetical protein n=1 Tax=Nocardioides sp. NPDC057772 TaxID=3346245 RepID=UPI00366E76B2
MTEVSDASTRAAAHTTCGVSKVTFLRKRFLADQRRATLREGLELYRRWTRMKADVWVDFNDISAEGDVTTLAKFASDELEIGATIVAGDEDGNRCSARVIAIDHQTGLVHLALDMGTFCCGDDRQLANA